MHIIKYFQPNTDYRGPSPQNEISGQDFCQISGQFQDIFSPT